MSLSYKAAIKPALSHMRIYNSRNPTKRATNTARLLARPRIVHPSQVFHVDLSLTATNPPIIQLVLLKSLAWNNTAQVYCSTEGFELGLLQRDMKDSVSASNIAVQCRSKSRDQQAVLQEVLTTVRIIAREFENSM